MRELGEAADVRWLAYPYRQPGNFTGAVLERLLELGIVACLEAHGGVNPPDFDPMNILRQGIDHNFTDLRLRAAVEGWRWRIEPYGASEP